MKWRLKMKKSLNFYVYYSVLIIAAICLSGTAVLAAQNYHQMRGKISAITLSENIVVVKCPQGPTTLTVGGQLGKNPVLLKNNKPVSLKDFKTGEHVLVGWRSTANGPVIERLIAG
jgi:hypothetical protein